MTSSTVRTSSHARWESRAARSTGRRLAEYVLRRDPDSLTKELNQVLAEVGGEPDPWLAEAARVTLERGEW